MSENVIHHCNANSSIGPDISFDGHTFWQPTDAGMLAVIEMAYRARKGDQVAIDVLTAFKIKVISGNGTRQYWPPKGKWCVSTEHAGGSEVRGDFATRDEARKEAERLYHRYGGACSVTITLNEDKE